MLRTPCEWRSISSAVTTCKYTRPTESLFLESKHAIHLKLFHFCKKKIHTCFRQRRQSSQLLVPPHKPTMARDESKWDSRIQTRPSQSPMWMAGAQVWCLQGCTLARSLSWPWSHNLNSSTKIGMGYKKPRQGLKSCTNIYPSFFFFFHFPSFSSAIVVWLNLSTVLQKMHTLMHKQTTEGTIMYLCMCVLYQLIALMPLMPNLYWLFTMGHSHFGSH